jgi:radical SAM protein with 4Fe4S-binding SPASM domain
MVEHAVGWAGRPVTGVPAIDDGITPPLPAMLQIEITGACNLRCHMCLVRYRPRLDRYRASMTFEQVAALVDANPNLERVVLQGLGEPLLAPDLVRVVEYATRRGIAVAFNTNGTLLTPRHGRELIDAGLAELCVSLDGATAATYESIRDGARFRRVVENLRAFRALQRSMGADNPDVAIVFVAMRRNLAELAQLVRLAADVDVRTVRVQNLSHSFNDCDPAGSYAEIRAFAESEAIVGSADETWAAAVFECAADEARRVGVHLRLPELSTSSPGCTWPWDGAYVTWDGVVQPCCMVMGSDRISLGDLHRDRFDVVWRDAAYRRFRAELRSDDPPAVCRGCSMYSGVF